ncbi:4983_t:CDS:2 [Paraglomus brasilianum]|uniref:ATP-dependent RNA helicase n=1 Tax=Paraglomus brasilianum TaxID=144538 RepID=A0A9N9F749_9GLOM|nr:4983_t:CDS:2 [Paraglomus brasilianum]
MSVQSSILNVWNRTATVLNHSLNLKNVVKYGRIRKPVFELESRVRLETRRKFSSLSDVIVKSEENPAVSKAEYVPARFSSIKMIDEQTQRALKQVFKYENMSKVQDAVLSMSPVTGDLFVKAKTGTGKTLAFLIPAIQTALRTEDRRDRGRRVSILVISPTRELAMQIAEEARKITYFHNFEVHCLVGGEPKGRQIRDLLRKRVDIVVGTPGRLTDLIESVQDFRRQCEGIKTLVLDEADQLLDMGFRQDIERLVEFYPKDRQTFLFSATISPEIREISRFALRKDYTFIDTVDPNDVNTNIQVKQSYIACPWESHIPTLRHIIRDHKKQHQNAKIIAFLPTRLGTQLYAELFRMLDEVSVFEIHSGKAQDQRSRVSERFRKAPRNAMLVTSDVSARGVDYPGVTLVLQIGAPSSKEQYIHRLGRTGRAGKEGKGILVLAPFEKKFLREVSSLPLQEISFPEINKEDPSIENVIQRLDADMVDSAFRAFLGYYVGKSDVIGARKETVLDAGAEFAAAFGLNPPPHISPRLRQALGFTDSRRSSGRGASSERRSGFRSSIDRRGGYNDRDSHRSRSYGGRDDYGGRGNYGGDSGGRGDYGGDYGGRGDYGDRSGFGSRSSRSSIRHTY